MTRVRVVSLRHFDPLIRSLSHRAFRAWALSLEWSCFHGTDGALSPEDVKTVGATPAVTQELLDRGVWKRDESGALFLAERREGPVVAEVEGCEVEHTKKLPMTPAERAKRYRETHRNTSSRRRDDPRDERHENSVTNSDEKRDGRDVTVVTHGSPAPPPDLVLSGSGVSSGSSESSSVLASDPKDLTGSARARRSKRKASVETEFPDDFSVTETEVKLANELGLTEHRERAAFKDKALAHGWTAKDWLARYRTWLRKAQEFSSAARPPGAVQHEKTRQEEARRPYHELFPPERPEPKASPAEALEMALAGMARARRA